MEFKRANKTSRRDTTWVGKQLLILIIIYGVDDTLTLFYYIIKRITNNLK